MTSPPPPHGGLVQQIAGIVHDHPGDHLTLAGLFQGLGARGAGFAVFVLSLPAFASGVPFVSSLFGLPLALIGAQMAFGRTVALPAFVGARPIPRSALLRTLEGVSRRLGALDRGLRPRWGFATGPLAERAIGLTIVALGLMISVPLPLTNLAPAIGAAIIGLGLAGRDGLVVTLGLGWGISALLFSGTAVYASGAVISGLLRA